MGVGVVLRVVVTLPDLGERRVVCGPHSAHTESVTEVRSGDDFPDLVRGHEHLQKTECVRCPGEPG